MDCRLVGGAESDMELDLLGESESDSDESTHSHADNASIQRSAVTAATAGSDAGRLPVDFIQLADYPQIHSHARQIYCS